jgi:hypothetical protein
MSSNVDSTTTPATHPQPPLSPDPKTPLSSFSASDPLPDPSPNQLSPQAKQHARQLPLALAASPAPRPHLPPIQAATPHEWLHPLPPEASPFASKHKQGNNANEYDDGRGSLTG